MYNSVIYMTFTIMVLHSFLLSVNCALPNSWIVDRKSFDDNELTSSLIEKKKTQIKKNM